MWTATHGKILTLDNLHKREIIAVDWCCTCKQSGESVNHLLLHCKVAQALWRALFTIFYVIWVMQGRVADLLAYWKGQIDNRSIKEVWRIASLCLMWIIWRAECKIF